jgi:hypothetical protein
LVRVRKDSPVELTLAVAVFSCFYSFHGSIQLIKWQFGILFSFLQSFGTVGGSFVPFFLEPLVITLVSTIKRKKWSLSKVNDPFDTFAALMKNSVSIPSDSECILVEFVLPRTQFSR